MNFLIDYNLTGDAVLFWGTRLIEILFDLENYMGVGRIFIP